MPHVLFETLVDYVRGACPAAAREEIRGHLAGCAECAESAQRLTRLAAVVRATADGEPPADVVDSAIALFRTLPTRANVAPDMGRLVFDSLAASPDVAAPRARVLRFETAGDIDLCLMVTEGVHGVSVSGTLSTRTSAGALHGTVSAHRESGRAIASARSNDSGEFRLSFDPPAAALLRFIVAGVLAPIHVVLAAEAAG